jgi:hypothetical protein
MLNDQALNEINREEELVADGMMHFETLRVNASWSNLQKMVSIEKLRDKGRMFLTQDEIFSIETGQLKDYVE